MEHFGLYAGSYGLALERLLLDPVQVVVVGSGPRRTGLRHWPWRGFAVNKTVMRIAPSRLVPGGIPEALAETLLQVPAPAGAAGVGAGLPRAHLPAADHRCGRIAEGASSKPEGAGTRGLGAGLVVGMPGTWGAPLLFWG